MGPWTASEKNFVNTETNQALADAGVAHDSPLKALLLRDAEISTAVWRNVARELGRPRTPFEGRQAGCNRVRQHQCIMKDRPA